MSTVQDANVVSKSIDPIDPDVIKLQMLRLKVKSSNGRGLPARICGRNANDDGGRSVRVVKLGTVIENDDKDHSKLKLIIELSDRGTSQLWCGWCDSIVISRGDHCIMLTSPEELPLNIY
jgi:hypothetical protein